MLVECTKLFRDLEKGVLREEGSTFEVTRERYKAINSSGYGQLVREVKTEEPEERPKATAKRPQKPRQPRRAASQE